MLLLTNQIALATPPLCELTMCPSLILDSYWLWQKGRGLAGVYKEAGGLLCLSSGSRAVVAAAEGHHPEQGERGALGTALLCAVCPATKGTETTPTHNKVSTNRDHP